MGVCLLCIRHETLRLTIAAKVSTTYTCTCICIYGVYVCVRNLGQEYLNFCEVRT